MKQDIDIEKIKDLLMKERNLLATRLQTNPEAPEITQNPDNTELALSFSQKEVSSLLTSADEERLQEIDVALEKIRNGSYGYCESCGQEIQAARLETLTTVIFCIACQREREE